MIDKNTVIAANRFGLGARPGELDHIGDDPRGWLRSQVLHTPMAPGELAALKPSDEILRAFFAAREERKDKKKAAAAKGDEAQKVGNLIRDALLPHYLAQAEARVRIAARTEAPFHERLVQFWTNHFAVSVDKPVCLGIAGCLENEAIRPHVTGHFGDMLRAVEQHPAMIAYLDNQSSAGPDSQIARFASRRGNGQHKVGINENLAREILELHTLGVDGGYTQADVTTFAKVLTGWSIGGGKGRLAGGTEGRYFFRENLHQPGAETLLGKTYTQSGEGQGLAVLGDLGRHPSTAKHLATKLARHFIADDPPAESVEKIAAAFRSSDGHLPTTYRALIDAPHAWEGYPAKFKTPQDFIHSTYRAFDVTPPEQRALLAPFEVLGQRIYSPGSPAGWPDTSKDWDGSDALMKRIEWSVAVGDRLASLRAPLDTAGQALGPALTQHTEDALHRAASTSQGLSLLLLSPEFQRR
ncbi:MAG TPA: DUF1800 domain-containing protein [Steroidobacteraceae bacterium]|nr:DUF1800 domain-containing protein [Steroidobacteraceae bacterium]